LPLTECFLSGVFVEEMPELPRIACGIHNIKGIQGLAKDSRSLLHTTKMSAIILLGKVDNEIIEYENHETACAQE